MVLSAKHRTRLFEGLEPVAGEEATEAMLAHFPATENDDPITKQYLRAELADLRGEMAELRGELRAEIAEVRVEFRAEIAEVRVEVGRVYHRLVGVIALATAILGAISGLS